jgi:tetratricopeptide (TPR) repeat protein
MQMDRAGEALSCFDAALAIEPRHPGLSLNRGNALARLGRSAEALAQFDAIVVAQPNLPEAHFNRGNVLASLRRLPEAIGAYDRALVLRADYVKARLSRSVAFLGLNRHREALADLDSVLAIDNANADAHNNAALALLTLGDFRRGFIEYDWRWRRTGMPAPRSFGKPQWLGEEALAGKTILLYAEQGLGDTIQFVRYVPIVARFGAKAVIEAPRELATLLARVEGVAEVIVRGEPLPSFDAHCPLGSLPRALRTEPSTIPRAVPYLNVSEHRVAKWRERLREIVSPRIAIAWSGSPRHPNDANRSIPLSAMEPIFSLEGLNVVSIQRELRDDDARLLRELPRIIHLGSELVDFDDTAAVMSLVDIVVSVDTAVAHLAGALARPARILVPFSPDWRWMLGRNDSSWYPTVRLFRQSAPGEWGDPIRKLADELKRISGTQ